MERLTREIAVAASHVTRHARPDLLRRLGGLRHAVPRAMPRPGPREADRSAETRGLLLQALEACGHGVITLDLDGRVEHWSARAGELIARYLPNVRPRRDQLPDPLDRWVREQECLPASVGSVAPPIAPLLVGQEHRLVVHLLRGLSQRLLLLRERVHAAEPRALDAHGLTRRETEVLTWIARGKTNDEIGTILGLSRRTAEKHVEHIFRKLGVDNRTTAARLLDTVV